MTYIRIDPSQGMSVGQTMVDAGHRSQAALERLSSLANAGGLGAWSGAVASEVGYARTVIENAVAAWLTQGVDMLQRLNILVAEQRASSVIGSVGTGPSAQALLGGSVVGGTTGTFPSGVDGFVGGNLASGSPIATSIIGGAATVGGTFLGQGITPMGGATSTVGGVFFGDGITSMGSGSAIVGGPMRDTTGTLALAGAAQASQERFNATLAGLRASGGGLTSSTDPVIAAQTSRMWGDLIGRQGIGTSLLLAPSGSRITNSGSASAGYQITGNYGSSAIESPIKYGDD
jgi:hypothetical protein